MSISQRKGRQRTSMTDKKTKVKTDPFVADNIDDKQLIEQLREEFDDLVKKYNQLQENFEGLQTHNEYKQDQIEGLQKAVRVLDDALKAKPLTQTEPYPERNKNRGEWVKFDCSNVALTRPIINMFNRFKDRPKEFYLEILGDEVIEVSETKL